MMILREHRVALGVLALASCIVFSPMFGGNFLLGGTDVQYTHYPNLLFGYDQFRKYGALSFWNPYIFAGMDMTVSMHAHYLNPLYWPLFLLPRELVFHGLTVMFFALHLAIGICWYLLGRREGLDPPAALIVGLVAGAGMFFWFAATTMIAVPMYAFSSAAILLVRTADRRSRLWQYIALTALFALILVTPHPAYLLGFGLPIIAAFVFTEYPSCLTRPWRGQTPAVIAAGVSGFLLAGYRLYPVLVELMERGDVLRHAWLPAISNHGYFALTTFNSLALGVDLFQSLRISELLPMNAVRHAQAHNGLYFGVGPLLLAHLAWFSTARKRFVLLWLFFAAFLMTGLYVVQQLSDLVNFLMLPAVHAAIYRIMAQFAFLALLLMSLRHIGEVGKESYRTIFVATVLTLGAFFCVELLMWARVFHAESQGRTPSINFFRIALIGTLAVTAFLARLRHQEMNRRILGAAIASAALLAFPLLARGINHGRMFDDAALLSAIINVWLAICAALLLWWLLPSHLVDVRRKVVVAAVAGLAIGLLLWHLPAPPPGDLQMKYVFRYSLAGAGKTLVLGALAVFIVRLWLTHSMDRSALMWVLAALTALDLLGALRTYSFVNTPTPFVSRLGALYPERDLGSRIRGGAAEAGQAGHNLLRNAGFERIGQRLPGWSFGGRGGLCGDAPAHVWEAGRAIEICAPPSADKSSLFQDVRGLAEGWYAFGAWVGTDARPGGEILLATASPRVPGRAVSIPSDSRWQWIEVAVHLDPPGDAVRPHIFVPKGSRVAIYAPRLVRGLAAGPSALPESGARVEYEPTAVLDPSVTVGLDQYRVNRLHEILGIHRGELLTNYASIYGVLSYAGVDSDMPSTWVRFLRSFVQPHPIWFSRAGIQATIGEPRLLDLLGTGIDLTTSGALQGRPSAVPRIAAYPAYYVAKSDDAVLAELKRPGFDPLARLVLDRKLGLTPTGVEGHARPLNYTTLSPDTIEVPLRAADPRLVFFGDRHSPYWRASWNGKEIETMRANFMFMAAALPEGEGVLRFEFRPLPFYRALTVSRWALWVFLVVNILGVAATFMRK